MERLSDLGGREGVGNDPGVVVEGVGRVFVGEGCLNGSNCIGSRDGF